MAGDGTTEAQHCRPACDKVTKRGGHWRSGQGQGGRFGEGLAPCEGLGLYPVRGSLVSPGQPLASVGGGWLWKRRFLPPQRQRAWSCRLVGKS